LQVYVFGFRYFFAGKAPGRLIDATAGHQTHSMVITDSGHIILSSFSAETLQKKLAQIKASKDDSSSPEGEHPVHQEE
jgi:regulator of extracellular matrix RemA (YlzA/DUF370 family)